MKDAIIAALKRAAHTAAQAALAGITLGLGVEDIDWRHIASVAAVAALYSLLKSALIGMPEASIEEITTYQEDPEDGGADYDSEFWGDQDDEEELDAALRAMEEEETE